MKSLTLVFITARKYPLTQWMLQSLCTQIRDGEQIHIIMVDLHADELQTLNADQLSPFPGIASMIIVPPKPCVWQGKHRLTKRDWWAIANAKNTGICLCKTEWIAFCDDRCVLEPLWLQAVRDAMNGLYAVAGSYEKRIQMRVEAGVVTVPGAVIGWDPRVPRRGCMGPVDCSGSNWFGCTGALPLEWALQVNGFDETCDSLGMEDVLFGAMLGNNLLPLKYDCRMKIIEDRTATELGETIPRTDKGVSPQDKSHGLKERLESQTSAIHQWDIRSIRNKVLAGDPFPIPKGPTHDWWDGKKISEFERI